MWCDLARERSVHNICFHYLQESKFEYIVCTISWTPKSGSDSNCQLVILESVQKSYCKYKCSSRTKNAFFVFWNNWLRKKVQIERKLKSVKTITYSNFVTCNFHLQFHPLSVSFMIFKLIYILWLVRSCSLWVAPT